MSGWKDSKTNTFAAQTDLSCMIFFDEKNKRNPTSLEYLSSGLNWVSDQLTSNLQKRQSNTSLFTQQEQHGPHLQNLTHCHDHYDHPQQQPLQGVTTSSDNEIVTFAAFQNVHRRYN